MRMNLEFVHFWKALRKSRGNCAFLEDVLNRMHVCLCSETQFEARVVCLKVVTCDLDRGSRTRVWKSVCVRALQRGSLVGSLKLASLYLVCCLVETEVNLGEKLSLWESFDLVLKLFENCSSCVWYALSSCVAKWPYLWEQADAQSDGVE